MVELKEQIKENLEFLNEQQLIELADFTAFLKVRSRIRNSKMEYANNLSNFIVKDSSLAEYGMEEYNAGLLMEDEL